MKVIKLNIARRASYEVRPGELIGTVTLEGDRGSQELVLSPAALSRIFGVIAVEVEFTARRNAKETRFAMDDAVHEPLLPEHQNVGEV